MSASSAERASARPLSSSACSSCTASRKGLAIGTAYASDRAGLSLFVILAIGLQNIPEGTSVAIPMAAAGFSRAEQFWAAVLTSAPQPVGAVARVPRRRARARASCRLRSRSPPARCSRSSRFELVPQAFGRGRLLRAGAGSTRGSRRRCSLLAALVRRLVAFFRTSVMRKFRTSFAVSHRWRAKRAPPRLRA